MDTINGSFTIQINGEPVTSVEENGEPQIHASVGSEPAVFTLTDGLLEFGEWRLGRLHIEDRSLSPKRVNWFKKGTIPPDMIQPSDAEPVGDSYDLTLGGSPLKIIDRHLFVDLLEEGDEVTIKMQ